MSNVKHFFDKEKGNIATANIYLDAIINAISDSGNSNTKFDKLKDLKIDLGQEFSDITWDQGGTSAQNRVLTGQTLEVTVNITGALLTQMAQSIPGFVINVDGDDGAGIISQIGYDQQENAIPIEIKKLVGDVETTDEAEMLILPVGGIATEASWSYNTTDQKMYTSKFMIYKSDRFTRSTSGAKMYAFTRDFLTAGNVADADNP